MLKVVMRISLSVMYTSFYLIFLSYRILIKNVQTLSSHENESVNFQLI